MSRKLEILDALIDILNTKGLDANFSISELAQKVDIGKSTIYEYFDTKDEILSEAVIRIFERAIESVHNHKIDMELPFEELMKNELRYTFTLARDSSHIFRYMMPMQSDALPKHVRNSGIGSEIRKSAHRFEQIFREIITKGVAEGLLTPGDIVIQGTLFASLISGSINRITNSNIEESETIDIDRYIDALYLIILEVFK